MCTHTHKSASFLTIIASSNSLPSSYISNGHMSSGHELRIHCAGKKRKIKPFVIMSFSVLWCCFCLTELLTVSDSTLSQTKVKAWEITPNILTLFKEACKKMMNVRSFISVNEQGTEIHLNDKYTAIYLRGNVNVAPSELFLNHLSDNKAALILTRHLKLFQFE